MSSTISVRFEPDGVEAAIAASTLVSEAAHAADVSLHLPCAGRGRCGKCRVLVLSGGMSEPTDEELELLGEEELARGVRLACQARILGDAIVEVPAATRVIGTKALNGDLVRPVPLQPNVRQYPLKLAKPKLEDQRSDFDRLAEALTQEVPDIYACPPALRQLSGALREAEFQVVASLVGPRLVAVHPGLTTPPTFGVAVDIGTTTVVAYVMDLVTGRSLATSAAYNEQGRQGADVISRIEFCNNEPDGLTQLRDLVLETINNVIADALAKCGCSREDVYEVTVVGNTAMNHLFIGLDPRYLAQAPYVPVSSRPQELRPEDAGIAMHPRGRVFCLPVIAGFVGADTVGVILATEMIERGTPVLAVDIGTNGEVALWSGERLLVASCAAGPAFEGAQIQHGMRAAPGAVEHLRIADGGLHLETIDGQPAVGICGSGLFDVMAVMLELGAVQASGRFVDGSAERVPAFARERLLGEGNERRFCVTGPDAETPICMTQRDVRELQLAKGAVRAAVDLLLKEAGLEPADLGQVLLAGAFGNHIEPASALRMGMLPDVPLEIIKGVGNAAGAGAVLALISTDERTRAVEIAARAEHIELSRRPDFQMAFMETMMFP